MYSFSELRMTTEELDAARAEHFKVVEAAPSTLILSKAHIRPQAPRGEMFGRRFKNGRAGLTSGSNPDILYKTEWGRQYEHLRFRRGKQFDRRSLSPRWPRARSGAWPARTHAHFRRRRGRPHGSGRGRNHRGGRKVRRRRAVLPRRRRCTFHGLRGARPHRYDARPQAGHGGARGRLRDDAGRHRDLRGIHGNPDAAPPRPPRKAHRGFEHARLF